MFQLFTSIVLIGSAFVLSIVLSMFAVFFAKENRGLKKAADFISDPGNFPPTFVVKVD